MNNRNLKILAGLGAVALGTVLFANTAPAFNVQADGTDPFTVSATTNVNNVLDVTITNALNFGTFGAVMDPVFTATATLSTANVFTPASGGGLAKIIDANMADHAAATITIVAFPSTELYADYSNVVNVAGTITPADVFTVTQLTDNLNAPNTGVGITQGSFVAPAAFTQGAAQTDGTGNLVFKIGGQLTTVATTVYSSEPYAGSFDLTMSY